MDTFFVPGKRITVGCSSLLNLSLYNSDKRLTFTQAPARSLAIVLLVLVSATRGMNQAATTPLDAYVKDILHAQLSRKIGLRLPLILNLGGFVYFQEVRVANNRIYFHEKRSSERYANYGRKTVLDEIHQSLNTQFIQEPPPGSSVHVKAYNRDRLLFNLTYQDKAGEQVLFMETLNNRFTKEVTYENYRLQTIQVKKEKKLFASDVYAYAVPDPRADSSCKAPWINQAGQPVALTRTITHYEKGNAQREEAVTKKEWFTYDPAGYLIKLITTGKGKQTNDSTRLRYQNDQLISRGRFGNSGQISQSYAYTESGQLREKQISTEKKRCTLLYTYDAHGRIDGIEIKEARSTSGRHVQFAYNAQSQLVAISVRKNSSRKAPGY